MEALKLFLKWSTTKAGIFCSSGQAAALRISQGFQMVTPGNEASILGAAAKAAVAVARGGVSTGSSTTGY
jgi:4-hydroxy-2-oxoheptanedioate aldolase